MLPARRLRHPLAALLLALGPLACSDGGPAVPGDAAPHDVATDVGSDAPGAPCDERDDPDRDGIPSRLEGAADADHDDVPDARDPDSDDDGIPDAVEAGGGRPRACEAPLADSDMDGVPDVRDVDSNGDTIPDAAQAAPSPAQNVAAMPALDCLRGAPGVRPAAVTRWTCHPFDTDGDGAPDPFDTDVDGDRIQNAQEIMPGGPDAPADTDGDNLPDYRDPDSDGDTIADVHEGALDRDGDGVANFRDRDSDGDSPAGGAAGGDASEAGDADPRTPPVECAREVDARTLDLRAPAPDGVPDYLDVDSDNDGLGDAEEAAAGTARCNPDTDGDGQLDSLEVAWCGARMRSRCALDPAVRVPDDDVWVVLPLGGPAVQRELEFTATLRSVDVFFLLDTSSRADAGRQALQAALGAPRDGVVERLRATFEDAQLGAGRFEDFAFTTPGATPYGTVTDRPFWPLCAGPPGSAGCRPGWGITLQPVDRASAVQATVQSFAAGAPGGDAPGSQVEALYQTLTGEGLFTGDPSSACAGDPGRPPCWVRPRQCPDGTRGAPCFRRGALPVLVLSTATDFHEGAPEMAGGPPWAPYAGIAPRPRGFGALASAFASGAARVVGLNANPATRCESSRTTRSPGDPCFDLLSLARASESVDRSGRPLVYDLPPPGAPATAAVDVVGGALRTLAREVPFDVTAAPRAAAEPPAMADPVRFVRTHTPSCQVGSGGTACWTPPAGVPMASAVARTDMNGFYRVVPGTRVRYTVSLRNENVFEGAESVTVFRLAFDAFGDGSLLGSREVTVVVPRSQ